MWEYSSDCFLSFSNVIFFYSQTMKPCWVLCFVCQRCSYHFIGWDEFPIRARKTKKDCNCFLVSGMSGLDACFILSISLTCDANVCLPSHASVWPRCSIVLFPIEHLLGQCSKTGFLSLFSIWTLT